MKIARLGRTTVALLVVIVIIPARLPSQPFTQINGQRRRRLVQVVAQGSNRCQRIEQRGVAVSTGDGVSQVGRHSLLRMPGHRRPSEVRGAVVERSREKK